MADNNRELRPISLSEEQTIFQNQFLRLYRVEADFGEFKREYFVSDKNQSVGVMVWKDDRILLVRQYRYVIDEMSWELPGGGVREGETLEEAAIRECSEEAGIKCEAVKPFFSFQHSVDVTRAPRHIFEAVGIASERALPENNETDHLMWLSASECVDKIRTGFIKEPMTIIALLMHAANQR